MIKCDHCGEEYPEDYEGPNPILGPMCIKCLLEEANEDLGIQSMETILNDPSIPDAVKAEIRKDIDEQGLTMENARVISSSDLLKGPLSALMPELGKQIRMMSARESFKKVSQELAFTLHTLSHIGAPKEELIRFLRRWEVFESDMISEMLFPDVEVADHERRMAEMNLSREQSIFDHSHCGVEDDDE